VALRLRHYAEIRKNMTPNTAITHAIEIAKYNVSRVIGHRLFLQLLSRGTGNGLS
jgi:hypothetical protein